MTEADKGLVSRKLGIPVQYLRCAMVARCATNLVYPPRKQQHNIIADDMIDQGNTGRVSSRRRRKGKYNLRPKTRRDSEPQDFAPTDMNCSNHERAIMWNAVLQIHEYVEQKDYDTVVATVRNLMAQFDRKLEHALAELTSTGKEDITHDTVQPVANKIRQELLKPYMNSESTRIIELDVNRSFHFDFSDNWTPFYRAKMQFQLALVCHIFFTMVQETNTMTHYYQGMNDIASVLLLVLGPADAIFALVRLSADHLRGFTEETMALTQRLNIFSLALVRIRDRELYDHLYEPNMEPIFAIPWYLTWFAHSMRDISAICELYDILLISSPLFCAYIAAALLLQNRQRVLSQPADMGQIHITLQDAVKNMPHRQVIVNAIKLYQSLRPHSATLSPKIKDDAESVWYVENSYTCAFSSMIHAYSVYCRSEVVRFPKFWMTSHTYVYYIDPESPNRAECNSHASLTCLCSLLSIIHRRKPSYKAMRPLNVNDPLCIRLPDSTMAVLAVKDIPSNIVDASIRGDVGVSWHRLLTFHSFTAERKNEGRDTLSLVVVFMRSACWTLGIGVLVLIAILLLYFILYIMIILLSESLDSEAISGHPTLAACVSNCSWSWKCALKCCLKRIMASARSDLREL